MFFWYGILTLGRWAGCFGELGWVSETAPTAFQWHGHPAARLTCAQAWNIRPKSVGQKWRPTAEFVESALIFTYGATNIFLEHLGGWGGDWTAEDMEHISITVLFIGGGLVSQL